MRSRLKFGLYAALLSLPLSLDAQHPTLHTQPDAAKPDDQLKPEPTPMPAATLSVDARLVNLPVIVRDLKTGALIQNLTKADFKLEVDNHVQTIRYFDQDANLPLTLGLLVDTSLSQRSVLDEERAASSAFIDQMLTGSKDQAFVVQFARQVELLADLTSSHAKLQAALKELDVASAPAKRKAGDDTDADGRGNRAEGGTALYDAVFLASDELMAKQQGRKAVILLTDGNDRNSKETLAAAIEAAQRADTILYAIYFKGDEQRRRENDSRRSGNYPGNNGGYPGGGYPGGGYPGGGYPGGGYPGGGYPGGGYPGGGTTDPNRPIQPRNDGRKTLERMAQETGGRLFEVSKKQKVADIYAEIGKELRAQYRLAYTPDNATSGDGYHQIDLSLTSPDRKKFTVQTRDGYFTGK